MKRYRPQLMPLVQRMGWIAGGVTWLQCHRRGCDWHGIGNGYKTDELELPGGARLCRGLAKVRCRRCGSIRLVRLEITVLLGGAAYIVGSPDGPVQIQGKDLKILE